MWAEARPCRVYLGLNRGTEEQADIYFGKITLDVEGLFRKGSQRTECCRIPLRLSGGGETKTSRSGVGVGWRERVTGTCRK